MDVKAAKAARLDVPRAAVEAVVAMGFGEAAATEALRRCGGDPDQAVALLVEGAPLEGDGDGPRCGQCGASPPEAQGRACEADGAWYCEACWAAWGSGGDGDDEDEQLALAIQLSMQSESRGAGAGTQERAGSPSPGAAAPRVPGPRESAAREAMARDANRARVPVAFRYGVDYPLPVLPPVSIRGTEETADKARREQAKRDRQNAEARRAMSARRGADKRRKGGGSGAGGSGDSAAGAGGYPAASYADGWQKGRWEEKRGARPAF